MGDIICGICKVRMNDINSHCDVYHKDLVNKYGYPPMCSRVNCQSTVGLYQGHARKRGWNTFCGKSCVRSYDWSIPGKKELIKHALSEAWYDGNGDTRKDRVDALKKSWDRDYDWRSKLTQEIASNQMKDPVKRAKLVERLSNYTSIGVHCSDKCGEIRYDSTWELHTYKILDQLSEVTRYERCSFGIEYEIKGRKRYYYPDILVHYKNGVKEIVEVKPLYQINNEENLAKFEAARKYSQENGFKFAIVTEQEIFN